MSETDLTVNVRANDQTTTVLSKAGQEYFEIAKRISEAERATQALEKAQAAHAKVTALTSDRDNPKLAASFVRVAEAMAKQKAAQDALDRSQGGGGGSAFLASLERIGATDISPVLGAVGTGFAVAGAAAVAAGGAILGLANHAAEVGGAMKDASDQLGVSAEFMSSMGFAAKQSGTSLEALQGGMQKLGLKAAANEADLKKFGLTLDAGNGRLRTNEELLYNAADAIQAIDNPTQKAETAVRLFGDAGVKLIPMLNEGSKGIKKLQAEATRLGVTMSTDAVESAAAFGDAMDAIGDSLSGVATKAGSIFLPVMTDALEAAKEPLAQLSRILDENSETLKKMAREGLASLVSGFASLIRGVGFAGTMFTEFRERLLNAQINWLEFKRRFTWDETALGKISDELNTLEAEFQDLRAGSEDTEKVFTDTAYAIDQLADSLRGVATADTAAAKAARTSDAVRKLREKGDLAGAKRQQALEKAMERNETITNRMDAAMERLFDIGGDEAMAPILEAMAALEQYNADAEEVDSDAAARLADQNEEIAAKVKAEAERQRKAANEAAKEAEEAHKKLAELQRDREKELDRVAEQFSATALTIAEAGLRGGEAFERAMKNALANIGRQIAAFLVSSAVKGLLKLAFVGTGPLGFIGNFLGFSGGGLVGEKFAPPGRTDTVPALLTPGEYVLSKPVVDELRRGGRLTSGLAAQPASSPSGRSGREAITVNAVVQTATPGTRAEVERYLSDAVIPALKAMKRQGALDFLT